MEDVVLQLNEIGAVKFGDFTLKSGIQSPIYIDLRIIVSFPKLLKEISDIMWSKISHLKFDVLCGVPYTALPIATSISLNHKKAMVMRRKEAKTYGTKQLIEGYFNKNDICLVIEDLVTSGTSVLETVESLKTMNLNVNDVIVLIDRQQGGFDNLKKNNLTLHSCYTITEILDVLLKHGKIDETLYLKVKKFLHDNSNVEANLNSNTNTNTNANNNVNKNVSKREMTYYERSKKCTNPILRKLFEIMETKKTNLCLSCDVTSCQSLLKMVDDVGPYICLLKTHIDILNDFTFDFISSLQNLSRKHNFLIFEDRKFADIGNTVCSQFSEGIYKISSWAQIVNAHPLCGPSIIQGLKQASLLLSNNNEKTQNKKIESNNNDNNEIKIDSNVNVNENEKLSQDTNKNLDIQCNHGLLLIAEMSSENNLINNDYTLKTIEMAKQNRDFVIGFISQRKLIENDPNFVYLTPGVSLETKNDTLGQTYLTPDYVIIEKKSDIIIVGRGIYKSKDHIQSAKLYRDQGWSAYEKSLQL